MFQKKVFLPLLAVPIVIGFLGSLIGVADRQNTAGLHPPLKEAYAAQAKKPAVDPKANDILKQMGEYLKTADRFTFHIEAYFEEVLETGQKLQYSAITDVAIRRPDRLHVEKRGDVANDSYFYNGKRITHFDRRSNTYASVDVPATIDTAFDHIAQRYGLTPPLVDLAYKDPYTILIKAVTSGTYIGLSRVRGTTCHHLAFQQDVIDWQVWVEDGWMRVPRKIVITYKKVEGSPQYMAFLSEWNFSPRFPNNLFDFVAPKNAKQVEITPVKK